MVRMSESLSEFDPSPRVLIVEDEPRLRDMLLHALPDMGFDGAGAKSGEEAMRIMEEHPHHIIVLDLNLPGMSGLEFFQKLREDEKFKNVQVVVLTGFGDLEVAQQAIHLGVADFLTKPCPLGELEAALERARKRVSPPKPKLAAADAAAAESNDPPEPVEPPPTAEERGAATLREIERDHILAALARNDGNRQATADELGISVRTLYYRLGEYQKEGFDV